MTSKEKRKGTYHENWWVNLFKSWGWWARRQPLSGILKDFPSDIEVKIRKGPVALTLICESKYRANGFALVSSILGKNKADVLLLKEKNGNAYICIKTNIAEKLLEQVG